MLAGLKIREDRYQTKRPKNGPGAATQPSADIHRF
jgi:hypothetical protein